MSTTHKPLAVDRSLREYMIEIQHDMDEDNACSPPMSLFTPRWDEIQDAFAFFTTT